jgi:plastocyanin
MLALYRQNAESRRTKPVEGHQIDEAAIPGGWTDFGDPDSVLRRSARGDQFALAVGDPDDGPDTNGHGRPDTNGDGRPDSFSSPQPTKTSPTPSPALAGIAVYMVDAHLSYFYNPAAITVPAGDVTFVLYSATFSNHNMRIGPEAPVCTATACTFGPVTASSPAVLAGSKPVEFTVEALAAGTYSNWCTIGNYAPLGMIGTLTVTP